MSGYGTPCSGEIEFWQVMRSSAREIVTQLRLIAKALEAANSRRTGPYDFRVGDIVAWKDPEGGASDGWKVVRTPPWPDPQGVVAIQQDDGTAAECFCHELTLVVPGGAK